MYSKYFQNKSFTYLYALTSLLLMHYLGGCLKSQAANNNLVRNLVKLFCTAKKQNSRIKCCNWRPGIWAGAINQGNKHICQTHHPLQNKMPTTKKQTAADMKVVTEVETAAEQQTGAEFQAVAAQNRYAINSRHAGHDLSPELVLLQLFIRALLLFYSARNRLLAGGVHTPLLFILTVRYEEYSLRDPPPTPPKLILFMETSAP